MSIGRDLSLVMCLDLAHLWTKILLISNFHILFTSYQMVQLKYIY